MKQIERIAIYVGTYTTSPVWKIVPPIVKGWPCYSVTSKGKLWALKGADHDGKAPSARDRLVNICVDDWSFNPKDEGKQFWLYSDIDVLKKAGIIVCPIGLPY